MVFFNQTCLSRFFLSAKTTLRRYLEGGKEAGGQLVDQRFCPRIVEGELRYNLIGDSLIGVLGSVFFAYKILLQRYFSRGFLFFLLGFSYFFLLFFFDDFGNFRMMCWMIFKMNFLFWALRKGLTVVLLFCFEYFLGFSSKSKLAAGSSGPFCDGKTSFVEACLPVR